MCQQCVTFTSDIDEMDEITKEKYKKVAVNNHLISMRLRDKVDKLLSENISLQEKMRMKEKSQEEQEHQHQSDVHFLENKITSLSTHNTEMEKLEQANSIRIRTLKNKLERLKTENVIMISSQHHCQDHIETLEKQKQNLIDLMVTHDEYSTEKYKRTAINQQMTNMELHDKVGRLQSKNISLQQKVRMEEKSQEEQEHQHQSDVNFLENKIKCLSTHNTEMEQLGQVNSIQIRMLKSKLERLERENTAMIRSQRQCQDHIETLGKENKYLRDLMVLLTDMFDFTIETGPNGSVRIVLDELWKELCDDT